MEACVTEGHEKKRAQVEINGLNLCGSCALRAYRDKMEAAEDRRLVSA